MKNHSEQKKLVIVVLFEVIVYFLAYLVEPFVIEHFSIGMTPDIFVPTWLFAEVVGAWVNLLLIPILAFLVMLFLVKEPLYWLTWIPVYFLMKVVYYPSDYYIIAFGLGNICVDSAAITVFITQYFVLGIVMVIKRVRITKERKKSRI